VREKTKARHPSPFILGLCPLTFFELLGNNLVAQPDALVADRDAGTRDEFLDILLVLIAEGASEPA
jgi:hypothetical protein